MPERNSIVAALLMVLWGLFQPLYRIGGDAMTADLVAPEQRDEAYALLRMATNVGVALGPALGGWLMTWRPLVPFLAAAAGFALYALLLALAARETLPAVPTQSLTSLRTTLREFALVLRDRRLWEVLLGYIPTVIAAMTMWLFLPVYTNRQFGLSEAAYGWIATTNAMLVVFFQFTVTAAVQSWPRPYVMAAGALLYALGVGSVAWGTRFWDFWTSMVVMTVGEMLLVPTAAAFVSSLAPLTHRGRYMATLGMVWNVGYGLVSPLGGWLSERVAPQAPWWLALVAGLVGMVAFLALPAEGTPPTPEGEETQPGETCATR